MKKILVFCALISSVCGISQNLAFADPDLKSALINQPNGVVVYSTSTNGNEQINNLDTNLDGEISITEASLVGKIKLSGASLDIESVDGIDGFLNLTSLTLEFLTLPELQLSNLLSLEELTLQGNMIGAMILDSLPSFIELTNYTGDFSSILIQNLTSLDNLDIICQGSINLDSFTVINCAVSEIHYHDSPILSINIQNCPNLELIDIDAAGVAEFNVENCPTVKFFNLNLMNEAMPDPILPLNLDLSGFTNLQSFGCNGWNLGNVNVTNLPLLTSINMSNCKLTNVDFTGSLAVTSVSLFGNSMLEEVDVSGMANLSNLNLGSIPALKRVFMKNGSLADNFAVGLGTDFSSLEFVCVDMGQLDSMQSALTTFGYTNVVVNSYCSFVPGGNYNTITGTVRFDVGSDGCDLTDPTMSFLRLDISGDGQGATFTTDNGNYNFYTEAGSFTLTPNFENQAAFNVSPATGSATFANDLNNEQTLDFCVSPNGSVPDAEIVIAPIGDAIPGFDAIYSVVIRNKGNTAVSGNFDLNYDDTVVDFISADITPITQNPGSLSWNFTNLLPFESRNLLIVFNLNAPTDIPSLNDGDILPYTATVTSGTDISPADNTFIFNHLVTNSLDPNDITCLEGAIVNPSEIGKYLHYLVNFENLGTASANNVVVAMDINPAMFDLPSLQLIDASANSYVRVTGNRAEFIFENIMLMPASGNPPVGGHGNVLFKIKSNALLETGDSVMNQAVIYFDYNFPVVTNDAESVFQVLSNGVFATDESIGIYPNPSNGIVTIKSASVLKSIELYDIQGRLLQTSLETQNTAKLDISDRSNGMYFIKINTDNGSKVEKLIKQ